MSNARRMPVSVVDALGRTVEIPGPARRVVSLVPSETESVAALAGISALAGRTDYCEEPAGLIERVPSVGGTKRFDVEAVEALRPDLVLANQEENGRSLVETLIARGVPVHVSFPCTVDDALRYLRSLALLLGVDPDRAEPLRQAEAAVERARREAPPVAVPLFVPIWMDPLMTFDDGAFASDLLAVAGGLNVFADRQRRYPLAADLGRGEALPAARAEGRDTRYPRITLDEIRARAPELILLPDEPHRFGEEDAALFRALDTPASRRGAIVFTSGKDLFWYGTRVGSAIARLRVLIGNAM